MADERRAIRVARSTPTIEGAGVHLKRALGFDEVPLFDPFLLLDDFRSGSPERYRAGFPWHPHRGIETVTYMLDGQVEHKDSMGNEGVIGPGDLQWMTAGSGIIHQEMPRGDAEGRMGGFQLWSNLPAARKMMDPRYRDVRAADTPVLRLGAAEIRLIAGRVGGKEGPVRDIVTEPEYLDVRLTARGEYRHPTRRGSTVFAYVIGGSGELADSGEQADGGLVLFGEGESILVRAGSEGLRFLLISGKPLREPVAWHGPIVMNTEAELETAFAEYRAGTFVRHRR
jgi:quercetin 2,3-dioxygenase